MAAPAPPSLRLATYVGCATLLLAQIALNFADIDLWHQMALIRESLAAGHLLMQDPFAYVPTINPMINHEWGAAALAFFFTKWMGGAGILLLKFGAAFAVLLLTMRLAERLGATVGLLCFMTPIAIGLLTFGLWPSVRAQAYSFLFTSLLLWVFEAQNRADRRWLWLWLVIFPIWVNLHAGFVVGIGFVLLDIVERAVLPKPVRPAVIVLCAMLLELLLNPYGARYLPYLARTLTMARPRIPEWGPIWTLGWPTTLVFAAALMILLYSFVKTRSWHSSGLLLLAASCIEAVLHRKMLPFFAVAWLCYVPVVFQKTPMGERLHDFARRRASFLVFAWSVTIVVCLIAAIRGRFWEVRVPQVRAEASYPVGAVQYLKEQKFHGNVMTPFRKGAYLSWKLYPAVKVSLDSRYDVAYPVEWVERVFRFYEGREGWRETLNAYPNDLVLAPNDAAVRQLLPTQGWKLVYRDDEFGLYARPGLDLPYEDQTSKTFSGSFP